MLLWCRSSSSCSLFSFSYSLQLFSRIPSSPKKMGGKSPRKSAPEKAKSPVSEPEVSYESERQHYDTSVGRAAIQHFSDDIAVADDAGFDLDPFYFPRTGVRFPVERFDARGLAFIERPLAPGETLGAYKKRVLMVWAHMKENTKVSTGTPKKASAQTPRKSGATTATPVKKGVVKSTSKTSRATHTPPGSSQPLETKGSSMDRLKAELAAMKNELSGLKSRHEKALEERSRDDSEPPQSSKKKGKRSAKRRRTSVEKFVDVAAESTGESRDGSGEDEGSLASFLNDGSDLGEEDVDPEGDVSPGVVIKSTEVSEDDLEDEPEPGDDEDAEDSEFLVRGEKGAVGLPCQRCIRALKSEATADCVFVRGTGPCDRCDKKRKGRYCFPVSVPTVCLCPADVCRFPKLRPNLLIRSWMRIVRVRTRCTRLC